MSEQHSDDDTTHFGYENVARDEKVKRVRSVFDSVADKYDIMNDLMSMGVHRLWKKFTIDHTDLQPGQKALDVAGGTGDLTIAMAKRVGPKGHVILSDINESMLENGRRRLIDKGIVGNVSFEVANAEELPFDDNSFQKLNQQIYKW